MPRLNASQSTRIFQWKTQVQIENDLLPPVLDNWYTLLNVNGGARIKLLRFFQANDELGAKDIEWQITHDDIFVDGGFPLVNNVMSSAYLIGARGDLDLAIDAIENPFSIDALGEAYSCHSFLFRYRIHTACGTNQELLIIVDYDLWEQI